MSMFSDFISRFLFDKPSTPQPEYEGQGRELTEAGQVIVEHYRDAKNAKDLVEARYLENHQYWAGRKEQEDVPETENIADFSVNICFPVVEGKTALALEKNMSIQCHGQEPSDQAFSEAAENLLEFINRSNKPMRKNEGVLRDLTKQGLGIYYSYFDDEWNRGFGLPTFERMNPMFYYIDDNIVDILHYQEAEYMFFIEHKTYLWAVRKFGEEKAKTIQLGSSIDSEENFLFDHSGPDPDNVFDLVHYFTREYINCGTADKPEWKGIMRYIQASTEGAILYDTKDDKNLRDDDGKRTGLYPFSDRYPFELIPDYPDDGSLWPIGEVDITKNLQNAIDALDMQVLNNARLTGNPQKLVDPDRLDFDYRDWTNEEGLVIPSKGGIDGVAKYMEAPQIPAYIINRRDRLFDVDRSVSTLHQDQLVGQQQKGVDTATEALAVSQGGMVPVDRIKTIYEEALSSMFSFLLDMAVYYWDEEKFFRIERNGKTDFFSFNPSILNEVPKLAPMSRTRRGELLETVKKNGVEEPKIPQYMQVHKKYTDDNGDEKYSEELETRKAMFDIQITIGAGMPQNKAFIYRAVTDLYKAGLLGKAEGRKMMVDMLNIPIDPEDPMLNLEDIVRALTENPQIIPQVLQQAQLIMQQGGQMQTGGARATATGATESAGIQGVAGQRPSPERVGGVM